MYIFINIYLSDESLCQAPGFLDAGDWNCEKKPSLLVDGSYSMLQGCMFLKAIDKNQIGISYIFKY